MLVMRPTVALVQEWSRLRERMERIALVCDAIRLGAVTATAVLAEMDAWPRVPDRSGLDDAITNAAAGCESPLEVLFVISVERAHGLPLGRRQVGIVGADGRAYRVDVLYDRVVVELDGEAHLDPAVRSADRLRDAALTQAGYVVLRFTWADVVHRPAWVAAQIRLALSRAA
jgi:very-short-patch-repair endonuclease